MWTWRWSQYTRLQAWCHDLRFGTVRVWLGWEWVCFAYDNILIIVARKLKFVALDFHAPLHPCVLVMLLHSKFGLDHVTCFGQWGKSDASRDLQKFLCISACSLSIPGTGVASWREWEMCRRRQVVLSEPTADQTLPVNLPAEGTRLREFS